MPPQIAPPAAITAARLQLFARHAGAMTLAPHLDREATRCVITSLPRVRHWMATLHHESAGFTRLEESLAYSPERLTQVWPHRFPTIAEATPYARNAAALANKVYGGRMGNGPESSGDGWKFRGRGFIQLTGREAYAKASEWTGLDLVADPDLAILPANAARIAADWWRVHGLNDLADRDDAAGIRRVVNGGLTGLDEVKRLVALAATIWRP